MSPSFPTRRSSDLGRRPFDVQLSAFAGERAVPFRLGDQFVEEKRERLAGGGLDLHRLSRHADLAGHACARAKFAVDDGAQLDALPAMIGKESVDRQSVVWGTRV